MTVAPSCAMISAVARPMPLAAAVISAILSVKRIAFPLGSFLSVQAGGLCHDLDRLGLAGPHRQTGGAGVLPGAKALADSAGRPDERLHIDPFVRHRGNGFFLAMREIEFLDAVRLVGKATADHLVLVEILVLVAHAADIQRNLRLQAGERGFDVVGDLDMNRSLDFETLQALAVAGAPETV